MNYKSYKIEDGLNFVFCELKVHKIELKKKVLTKTINGDEQ